MKNKSFADSVAADMNNIISSNEFKSIFARPTVKTASVNKDESKDCDDTNDASDLGDKKCTLCNEDDCVCNADDSEVIASAINLLVKASERLDRVDGFDKSAMYALYTLEVVAKEAAKKANKEKDSKKNKKDDNKEEKKDKDKKVDKKTDKKIDKKEDKSKGKKPENKKKSKNVKKANIDTDINDVSLTAELLGEDQISAFDDEIEDPNSSEIASKLLLNTPGLIDGTRKRLSLLDDDLDLDIHSDSLFDDENEDENEDDIALPPPPIVPNDFRETVPAKPRKDASINRKAFMGHPYSDKGDKNYSGNIKLWKVYIDLDGYEQPGGSYWGVGEPLWRYESDDEARERDEYVYGNVRAWDREEAEELVRAKYPNANILPEDPADVAEYEEQESLDLLDREESSSFDELEEDDEFSTADDITELHEFDKKLSLNSRKNKNKNKISKLDMIINLGKFATNNVDKAHVVGYDLYDDIYCKDCFNKNKLDKNYAEQIHADSTFGLTCKECDTDLEELNYNTLDSVEDDIDSDLTQFDMISPNDSEMDDDTFHDTFGITREELKDIEDNEYFNDNLDEHTLF